MVYVVVGEWGGLVEAVHTFKSRASARKKEREIKKEYGSKLDDGYATVAIHDVVLHR